MAAKTVIIFPETSNDYYKTFYVTTDVDSADEHVTGTNTAIVELKMLIQNEFGLSLDTNFGLLYYKKEREILIPISALKSFCSLEKGDLTLRLKVYYYENSNEGLERQQQINAEGNWEDDKYFGEYGHLAIHWHMLKDTERCNKYQEAIQRFKEDIKGKIVLDVGCGTGILSCFCAKAGAKKVYAIEASEMASNTEIVIAKNGLSNVIEVIHGKVEQIQLPVEQVDVIISEWMGIFLLFESMLESVIFARNKWLKPEGLMFPAEAKMYLAPLKYGNYTQERIEFFGKPINGIDLSPLVPFAKEEFTDRCLKAEAVTYDVVVDKEVVFYEMDIKTVNLEDPRKIIYEFEFEPECGYLDGFVTWFDVTFKGSDKSLEPLVLSTSPKHIQTHWRQDIFLMTDRIQLPDANKKVKGFIRATQQKKWRRHYEVEFSFQAADQEHYKQFLL